MHSTDNLDDGYLGSGNRLIQAIAKHGKENFKREILEFCSSREELALRESEIVDLDEIAKKDCMNLKVGGIGGGRIWNEEHMKAFSKAGNEAFRKKLKDDGEFREKFSSSVSESNTNLKRGFLKSPLDWTGRLHSEETKSKMKESKSGTGKGDKNSQFGTCWITNGSENKKIKKTDDLPKGWSYGRKIKIGK